MMNKSIFSIISISLGCVIVAMAGKAAAERTKVIAIKDIIGVENAMQSDELIRLTEAVYAAATEASLERFSVVSRQKLLSISPTLTEQKNQGAVLDENIGALLGADLVFFGELRQKGVRYEVTLRLVETGSGRILGLERVEAQDLDTLWSEIRKVARQMLMPLAASDLAAKSPILEGKEQGEEPKRTDYLIQFKTTPADSSVTMDGKVICKETPCSYRVEPGTHVFIVSTERYKDQQKTVVVSHNDELVFELEPKKYNYLGMHDAKEGGFGVTVGVSPINTDYKSITVFDGYDFSNLHPVFDLGFGGQIFGYRQTPRGSSWSIFGFGPVIRAGRIILSSQVQLLSFRPHPVGNYANGWLPGVTTRAQIPLVNRRETGGWAALIPTPTVGLDVWFHNLDYDQYQVWLGLSWLGGIHH